MIFLFFFSFQVAPLIIGPLVENDDLPSYQFAEFIFAGCASVAACTTMLLILVDGYTGDGLLYSGSKRIRMMQAKQVRLLRQQKKEKRRKREREAAAAEPESGTEEEELSDDEVTTTTSTSRSKGRKKAKAK